MAKKVELSRRDFLAALTALPAARLLAQQRTPTFTVLSLFRPRRLVLHADKSSLQLTMDAQLRPLMRGESIAIDAASVGLLVAGTSIQHFNITSPAVFALEVPGKLRRTYRGTLAITSGANHLVCVVGIERELAVASIVAAESPPHAATAALAAQAVAARSFLAAARTAHLDADFCDTTHCQFLREPPPDSSAFNMAAAGTAGLVLQYRTDATPRTLPAMYSRSCGGRTRTLAELGLPSSGYPYYGVRCTYCEANPEVWHREASDVRSERERLAYNRIHGWSALPGHADTTTAALASGRGVGHGLGMCQRGAAAMASDGATFAEILAHYYPNTTLTRIA